MQDYPYQVYNARADYIDPSADTSKYDYQVLDVAVPEGSAPHNYTCWYSIIETVTEV